MKQNMVVEALRLRDRHSHWVPFVLMDGIANGETGKPAKNI
jgi:hypothetical protein